MKIQKQKLDFDQHPEDFWSDVFTGTESDVDGSFDELLDQVITTEAQVPLMADDGGNPQPVRIFPTFPITADESDHELVESLNELPYCWAWN